MRRILFLIAPIMLLSGCFTATKSAFDELTKGSKSQCPIASKSFYKVLKDGKSIGEIKFAAEKIATNGDTACYLTAANGLDANLGTDIRTFVSRGFYKINSDIHIAYNKPYVDKGSLYFIKSDNKGGWHIYGTCKKGTADCPTATTKQGILDLTLELPLQKPSYSLELVK